MGRRKTILKIAKRVKLKCPKCSEMTQLEVPEDGSPQFFECSKCSEKIKTPLMQCCVICAFSDKRCSRSSIMEAHARGLELRR
jgi:phage FluMu protein Com